MNHDPACPCPAPSPESAAAWQVALRESPGDDAVLAAHARWLDADPGHRQEWQEIQRLWQMLGASSLAVSAAHDTALRPEPHRAAPPRRRWRAAAALAVAACLALMMLTPDALLHLRADAVTAAAETRRLDLADGSRLHLAPDSAVSLAISGGSARQVTLLRGTAFFEVAPHNGRSFQVRAADVTTTVLGTAFEVSRRDGGVRIAVEHGRVRVTGADSGASAGTDLTAGEAVAVDGSGALTRTTTPAALVAAWRRGQLVARDRPVREVVAQVDAYVPGWVVVTDDALANRTVTGFFDLTQPEAALEAIAASHGARVQQITPWLRLVKPAT